MMYSNLCANKITLGGGQTRKRPRVTPGPSSHHAQLPQQTTTHQTTGTIQPSTSNICRCPECLQTPCIVISSPAFLKGSGMPDISNVHKRFKLYKKCWSYLQKQGVWIDQEYLNKKSAYTTIDDPREIMPWCICQVRCDK